MGRDTQLAVEENGIRLKIIFVKSESCKSKEFRSKHSRSEEKILIVKIYGCFCSVTLVCADNRPAGSTDKC